MILIADPRDEFQPAKQSDKSVVRLLTWLMACLSLVAFAAAADEAQTSARNDLLRALHEVPAWRGDWDAIRERGILRVATTFNKTSFFLDEGQPKGATYEALVAFEKYAETQTGDPRDLHVILIPVARDELLPALVDGRADLAAANLTITPERLERVGFSSPIMKNVQELLVTGPDFLLGKLDDLAGQAIHVRHSSSYFETLRDLSSSFESRGLAPIDLPPISELLETEDILELVNSGVFTATLVDNHLANAWAKAMPELKIHAQLPVNVGRSIGWAFRKESPGLKAVVDRFVADNKKGTLFGNIMLNRYFRDSQWIANPTAGQSRIDFESYREYFRQRGQEFGMEWLLLAAQGFQESRFKQEMVSSAGAIGIMQIKPSTAADPNVDVADIHDAESNIHAGTKYLAFLRDRYFSGPELDQPNATFLALAAYNAGPARIRRTRAEAGRNGLDPNVWFGNVEHFAPRETVQYVSNILKYYISYAEYLETVATARQQAIENATPDS